MGYHIAEIKKGELGELSKIREELDELEDAEVQGNTIMQLVELSDIYGAIEFYLDKYFPNFSMTDLSTMSIATKRSFLDGERK